MIIIPAEGHGGMGGSTKLGKSSGGQGGMTVSSLTMSATLGTPKSTTNTQF